MEQALTNLLGDSDLREKTFCVLPIANVWNIHLPGLFLHSCTEHALEVGGKARTLNARHLSMVAEMPALIQHCETVPGIQRFLG